MITVLKQPMWRLLCGVLCFEVTSLAGLAFIVGWDWQKVALIGASFHIAIHVVALSIMYILSKTFGTKRAPSQQLTYIEAFHLLCRETWAFVVLYDFRQLVEPLVSLHDPKYIYPTMAPPVLLLHGFSNNAAFWWGTLDILKYKGIRNVFTMNLEPIFASIEHYTAQVAVRVEEILALTGAKKIIIVGHSMGGLCARNYLRSERGKEAVAKIITLGSPHHGTYNAYLSLGANAISMRPNSVFLKMLNDDEHQAPPCSLTSIYSHHDNVISPQDSSVLRNAKNIPVTGIGHLEMSAENPEIRTILLQEIRSGILAYMRTLPEMGERGMHRSGSIMDASSYAQYGESYIDNNQSSRRLGEDALHDIYNFTPDVSAQKPARAMRRRDISKTVSSNSISDMGAHHHLNRTTSLPPPVDLNHTPPNHAPAGASPNGGAATPSLANASSAPGGLFCTPGANGSNGDEESASSRTASKRDRSDSERSATMQAGTTPRRSGGGGLVGPATTGGKMRRTRPASSQLNKSEGAAVGGGGSYGAGALSGSIVVDATLAQLQADMDALKNKLATIELNSGQQRPRSIWESLDAWRIASAASLPLAGLFILERIMPRRS